MHRHEGCDLHGFLTVAPLATEAVAIDYPSGDPGCARRLVFDAQVRLVTDSGSVDVAHRQQISWSSPFTDEGLSIQLAVSDWSTTLPWKELAPAATELVSWMSVGESGFVGYLELSQQLPPNRGGRDDHRVRFAEWNWPSPPDSGI